MITPITVCQYDNITKAITFAAKAHRRQYKKGTNIPYIFHPVNLGRILIENDCIASVVIAGILHDVLEDTNTTPEEIKSGFGKKVLKYVLAGTEPNKDEPWEVRKKQTIEKAKSASIRILQIMRADKYDNISQIQHDLEKEGDVVWERFSVPKQRLYWYYTSLVDIFLNRFTKDQDLELAKKLKIKVEEVFQNPFNRIVKKHNK